MHSSLVGISINISMATHDQMTLILRNLTLFISLFSISPLFQTTSKAKYSSNEPINQSELTWLSVNQSTCICHTKVKLLLVTSQDKGKGCTHSQ